MQPSRLCVALACPEGDWPHQDWPDPDDPHVDQLLWVPPPYWALREGGDGVRDAVDVVVLRSEAPSEAFVELLDAMGGPILPVLVVSPRRDAETIVEVFGGGAGYLVEGDYCTCALSSVIMQAVIGHTSFSPLACTALREEARRASMARDATQRLRNRLSPREREIMELLSTGLSSQEIGQRMRLSGKTVRNNLSNIYAKLGARGGTDAVLRWLGAASIVHM